MTTKAWIRKSIGGFGASCLVGGAVLGANPTVDQALALKPIQTNVEYDLPKPEDAAKCVMAPEKVGGHTGWVVRTAGGDILRKFIDDDDDGHVNLWCYYKDGVEVYRDIDTNANRKVDQSRWVNIAGSRWGLDSNEDGRIDAWKSISAEEVTAELVQAVRDADEARFAAVLLSDEQAKALGVSADLLKELQAKREEAKIAFAKASKDQKVVGASTKWTQFGAGQPGAVPAGTVGEKDIRVYENVLAMLDGGDGQDHLAVGTLVETDTGWRAIDLPSGLKSSDSTDGGFFFRGPASSTGRLAAGTSSDAQKELLDKLDALDKEAGSLKPSELYAKRAELLEKIAIAAADAEDRDTWSRQLIDMLSAAVQTGEYPEGKERLQDFAKTLVKEGADGDIAAYAEYRLMMADYIQSQSAPNADFAKIQEAWLKRLEQFIKDYPKAPEAAEALLEVATTYELAGQLEDASKWYGEVTSRFADSPASVKAAGAKRRLDSVGKSLSLKSTTVEGKPFDLSKVRGKVVVVHYWASWSDLCRSDLAQLKELQTKYAAKGLTLVGVSLDTSLQDLKTFLTKSKLPWTQIYEDGGLEGRLAQELGIRTVPTIFMLDEKGKVIKNNVHVAELEGELGKLLR